MKKVLISASVVIAAFILSFTWARNNKESATFETVYYSVPSRIDPLGIHEFSQFCTKEAAQEALEMINTTYPTSGFGYKATVRTKTGRIVKPSIMEGFKCRVSLKEGFNP